jgi:DNA-directed RNA polymerase subunit M/transcription elongation factor TFIIS
MSNKVLEYIKNTNIENFDITKLKALKSDFVTENSKDIPYKYITYAKKNISRNEYLLKLNELISDINISKKIENSIFEYSLIEIILSNLDKNFIAAIYEDKFQDIYDNLNENSRFKNKTLIKLITKNIIDPSLIAFLSSSQLNPDSYSKIFEKIQFKKTTEDNLASTDLYKCYKCGERKSKITELQLRCADEPVSRFITCLVCYNTFII